MKFLTGFILGLILLPACIYIYFSFGYAPVATSAPPIPFEERLARAALHQRIGREYPRKVPFEASETQMQSAAHLYREHCAICHGLPDNPRTATATGMYPKPPQLFHGTGVTDDEPGETYWKVANGIRLTGMPAYRTTLTDEQMWSISQMLAKADKLPASVMGLLKEPVHEP